MAGLVDGLGYEELGQVGSQVANLWLTGSIVAESKISGAQVFSAGSVRGKLIGDSDGKLRSSCIGSPSSFGKLVQGGNATLGAGSDVWIVFGTAFSSTPEITFGNLTQAGNIWAVAGSLNAGSAYVQGDNASDKFSWIAIG